MSTQPSCYGKRWDPNHVACKGGLDPAYSNPRTGTKLRDGCSWFQACQSQTQQMKQAPLLPPTSLLRHPAATPAPARPVITPSYTPFKPPIYTAPQVQYALPPSPPVVTNPTAPVVQQQAQPQTPYNYAPAHVAQYGPAYVPMPYQNPGSQMPQYLTVPEPVTEDVHWGVRLGRELFRAAIKALGHQLAAYIDSHSFRRHDHRQ